MNIAKHIRQEYNAEITGLIDITPTSHNQHEQYTALQHELGKLLPVSNLCAEINLKPEGLDEYHDRIYQLTKEEHRLINSLNIITQHVLTHMNRLDTLSDLMNILNPELSNNWLHEYRNATVHADLTIDRASRWKQRTPYIAWLQECTPPVQTYTEKAP